MPPQPFPRQQGAALLALFLIMLLFSGLGWMQYRSRGEAVGRTTDTELLALTQAREALIGFAATYRERNTGEIAGYLPCPDTNNDGVADPPCGAADETVVGRLPWKTLGLEPLRDSSGECLWYVVSGQAKDNPKTARLNWDTPGQFILQDSNGRLLAGTTPHTRPWAVIIAPGPPLPAQNRQGPDTAVCPGNDTAANYLEGLAGLAAPTPTLTLATVPDGTINDRGHWLDSQDIFKRLQQRSDFKSDLDTLLTDLANCLNGMPVSALPAATLSNKGVGTYPPPLPLPQEVLARCRPAPLLKQHLIQNWQDNLLYARPGTANGNPDCLAVLVFSGARNANQTRWDEATRSTPGNYLEDGNVAAFATGGSLQGPSFFDPARATADLPRCITGLPSGATQISFAESWPQFFPGGAPSAVLTDPNETQVQLLAASSTSGGCFWHQELIPLAGKTLRTYYEFQLAQGDSSASGSGSDRGNGFTLQFLQGNRGLPSGCGPRTRMGAMQPADGWLMSIIVETDVHRDIGMADPAGNHTAILINGDLQHASPVTPDCNGSTSSCRYGAPNYFEEWPTPLPHNQRVEIRTGCNSNCTTCQPAAAGGSNTYARVSVWSDCQNCSDLSANHTTSAPNLQRCLNLPPHLNSTYVGFTGGFLPSTASTQAVTLRNFALRSE